jgi:Dimethyladenosine transferase (rRNA methylation)
LGQNFLAQTGVIQKLAAAAGIRPGQAVLEIGPGTGNLTEQLAKTGNKIIGVEKDREMIPGLKQRFGNAGNVQIINDDALKFDETKILPPYKIAANLPFYLAAPLIRKFFGKPKPAAIADCDRAKRGRPANLRRTPQNEFAGCRHAILRRGKNHRLCFPGMLLARTQS